LSNEYAEHWRGYKRIRNQYLLLLACFPVVIVIGGWVDHLFQTLTSQVLFVFGGAWTMVCLVAGFRLNAWRCPRCGKWFSCKWWYGLGVFARKCVHCGLPKYANSAT
jgi:hypothetical protein